MADTPAPRVAPTTPRSTPTRRIPRPLAAVLTLLATLAGYGALTLAAVADTTVPFLAGLACALVAACALLALSRGGAR